MEQSAEHELNPEWQEAIREGLVGALESYEIFDQLITISPFVLTEGAEEREFQELSPTEQSFVTKTLFDSLGINPTAPVQVAAYSTEKTENMVKETKSDETWSGIAEVSVFETNRSEDENMYLHMVKFPDGKLEYSVAPKDFKL